MLSGAALWETARRKRFDGIKRLNCERGRLCLSVRICFGWISLRGCLRRDTALLNGEKGGHKCEERKEKKKKKKRRWFALNVEETG